MTQETIQEVMKERKCVCSNLEYPHLVFPHLTGAAMVKPMGLYYDSLKREFD